MGNSVGNPRALGELPKTLAAGRAVRSLPMVAVDCRRAARDCTGESRWRCAARLERSSYVLRAARSIDPRRASPTTSAGISAHAPSNSVTRKPKRSITARMARCLGQASPAQQINLPPFDVCRRGRSRQPCHPMPRTSPPRLRSRSIYRLQSSAAISS
jgi:hypothetical protein